MKIKILKYLSTFLTVLLLISCNDSFLDHKPLAKASEETFYSTMQAADQAVTACYSDFCLEKDWDLTIMMTLGSISSDEVEAGAGGKADVPEYQHVDQLTHTPNEANVFQWPWGYLYRAIFHCNTALEKLPKITAKTDSAFDADLMQKRLGEVHFLRAINYFVLTQIFGGVPLIDHVPAASDYSRGRDDISKVYGLVKNDLRFAIAVLPEKSAWGPANIGRASKSAASALLAKVFLYESSYAKNYPNDVRFVGMAQNWDSVLFFAKQVIASNEFELVGINHERFKTWRDPNPNVANTGGYQWIFMMDGNNSKEGVFEIQNSQINGLGWFDTRGTGLVRWCAPRKVSANIPKVAAPNPDGIDFGWGWMSPTKFLTDAYEPGDPRYKATVMTHQDTILCNIVSDGGLAWRHPNFNILYAGTGDSMNQRKYECSYAEYWKNSETWEDGPIDVKLIRFADVVLWAAEASFELGNNSDALIYINMVRKRARESGETGQPADLTGTLTHDQIVHERLVELACEGHRFFDLVRWNLAVKYLNTTMADGSPLVFTSPKFDFFPIPEREIALSGNHLTQYPGW